MADDKTLFINLSVLNSKITMLGNLEDSMNRVRDILMNLAGRTGEFWQGTAYDEFLENQKFITENINKFSTEIETCKTDLTQAIRIYERVENENVNNVEDLSTSNIF